MLTVDLGATGARPPRLLFIGAHCDDIEIGCGGTVIELLRRYPDASVHWVVLSSGAQRRQEASRAAQALLRGVRDKVVSIQDFRGSYFPSEQPAIKDYFETLKAFQPDVVFTHFRDDLHQDHRITGELTWNTFRDHLILEYEIPKFDGGLGSPSVFVPISQAARKRKVDLLMRTFKTQLGRSWFTRETFDAIMRLRGIECNAPSGYAEAFYSRKLVLST
ncbi:PIG-L deacetylase family protein [Hydrogenophaga sp.]|uniref:PIG-L deacetylase family protein n=1 Tax=Hydrogenophaga sp. TaxID=1904254 RepID=UPI0026154109|nr:PIG-L deacetylase family protein [Hydrogenophaga sp.]MCW5652277.1 PIG-L family deacetylase [Hydrogenophaga sp.]